MFSSQGMTTRRRFLETLGLGTIGLASLSRSVAVSSPGKILQGGPHRVPVIDITDLYHPHQDVGDNFDLIAGYALPEIDLKAVILDATDDYRHKGPQGQIPAYRDETGPRDPGIIPVTQLNYLFDRNVPYGICPFSRMKSPLDQALDAPQFQQSGIELILKILRESPEKVEILSFGSARPLAIAYNRNPGLLRRKVRRIHLAEGSSSPDFLEWNVMLDPHAFVRLLRSDLPIAIYPCATAKGAFDLGVNNSFWLLPDLQFVRRMDPLLQRYLAYGYERSTRPDFLVALEEDPPSEVIGQICQRSQNVWETALWTQVAQRRLVKRADGHYRLVPKAEIQTSDSEVPERLVPCHVDVCPNGLFTFEKTTESTNFLIYEREDPKQNELALREALPALYESFSLSWPTAR